MMNCVRNIIRYNGTDEIAIAFIRGYFLYAYVSEIAKDIYHLSTYILHNEEPLKPTVIKVV